MLKATCLYTFLRQKFHFNPSRQTESLSCGKQRRFGTDAVANHDNQHLWPGSRAQEVCLMRQLGAEDACQERLASSGNLLEGLWQSLQRNPKLLQLLRSSGYEASTTFGAKHDNLWRILTAVIASGQKIIYILLFFTLHFCTLMMLTSSCFAQQEEPAYFTLSVFAILIWMPSTAEEPSTVRSSSAMISGIWTTAMGWKSQSSFVKDLSARDTQLKLHT